MFRFSIRDVLWLTALVAVLIGWLLEHCRAVEQVKQAAIQQREADRNIKGLQDAVKENDFATTGTIKALEAKLQAATAP